MGNFSILLNYPCKKELNGYLQRDRQSLYVQTTAVGCPPQQNHVLYRPASQYLSLLIILKVYPFKNSKIAPHDDIRQFLLKL
jgi:hypothetical protein